MPLLSVGEGGVGFRNWRRLGIRGVAASTSSGGQQLWRVIFVCLEAPGKRLLMVIYKNTGTFKKTNCEPQAASSSPQFVAPLVRPGPPSRHAAQ